MRLRNMTALTNDEVEWYLSKNDIIFVPVGTVEMHGPMPVDVEYTAVEALAYMLAEDCDGLVLPHMTFFHPGATTIGRATVYMSMTEGINSLKNICTSLVRQGFRRIVLLSAHGPSFQTIMPFITQFFDETKIPLFHGDMFLLTEEAGIDPEEVTDMFVAAYKYLGRLDQIAVEGDLDYCRMPQKETTPTPEFMRELMPKRAFSYYTAWYYGDKSEHAGMKPICKDREELEERAAKGMESLKRLVSNLHFSRKLEALHSLDQFTQDTVLRKYGEWLP